MLLERAVCLAAGIVVAMPAPVLALTPAHAELIEKAGNASVEVERYRFLLALSRRADLDPALRSDLAIVLEAADLYANERQHWSSTEHPRVAEDGFLSGYLRDGWPAEIPESSPLYSIWCLYRGRMLIQRPIQSGNLAEDPDERAAYYGTGRKLLAIAREAYPHNRIVRMYLGEHIPWPPLHPHDARAPTWANLQREVIEKMTWVIRWWIRNRQAPDGQFGGGWGDDVEMWRVWVPVLLGFEDAEIVEAQRRVAEGLFATERMKGGYTNIMSDVEHTAEDSGDTITSMMHLLPEDPVWRGRATRIFQLFRDLWTDRNQRGQLVFKGTYFTAERVHPRADFACDTVYHPRAVQPSLLFWQRTANPEMARLFGDWMKTWVAASAVEERGKPKGVLPSAIHWPGGAVGGTGVNWWDPRNHDEPTLYLWPSAMSMMTNTLLLTAHMTGDSSYLDPVRTMAEIRAAYLRSPVEDPAPGSEAWCASRMGFLATTLGKYRLLTGDPSFDPLLSRDANGYTAFRLDGRRDLLVRDLRRQAEAYRVNRESYCEEVRWTDRLLAFPQYANDYLDDPIPTVSPVFVYSTITGDPGGALYFPMNAVRWKTRPDDIAALVTRSGTDRFEAELFHFGEEPRDMGAELLLLARGGYEWTLAQGEGHILAASSIQLSGPRTAIRFQLPSRELCTLAVKRRP